MVMRQRKDYRKFSSAMTESGDVAPRIPGGACRMKPLLGFEHEGRKFEVSGSSWTGLEMVTLDGREVSRMRSFGFANEHRFDAGTLGEVVLAFHIIAAEGRVTWELRTARGAVLTAGASALRSPARASHPTAPTQPPAADAAGPAARKGHWVAWTGIVLKVLQTGKVLKVALAGMAVSGWAVIYSLPFALAIVATLVFHEYGHLRAMRHFGIPTKGMYLIPFVGGIAVGEKPRTHWEDIYISMMGPMYGLGMTIVCYVAYLATDSHFIGLVASVSALVNVFNLLPIHPLDGGRVVKALVFSGRSNLAIGAMLLASAVFFALAMTWGLYLLTFFIVIGALDLLSSWRDIKTDTKPPLNRYGIMFSLAWYVLGVAVFLAIILLIAAGALPGSELAVKILQS
jgi:Zn-dependent protease